MPACVSLQDQFHSVHQHHSCPGAEASLLWGRRQRSVPIQVRTAMFELLLICFMLRSQRWGHNIRTELTNPWCCPWINTSSLKYKTLFLKSDVWIPDGWPSPRCCSSRCLESTMWCFSIWWSQMIKSWSKSRFSLTLALDRFRYASVPQSFLKEFWG